MGSLKRGRVRKEREEEGKGERGRKEREEEGKGEGEGRRERKKEGEAGFGACPEKNFRVFKKAFLPPFRASLGVFVAVLSIYSPGSSCW